MEWDPERYLGFADERGRPFAELLARVGARSPAHIVDLGCGPANLTALLARRWPGAQVLGVDASPQMIARARQSQPRLDLEVADLRDWLARGGTADVVVSNATLQWLPDHLDLLPALVAAVAPGGWLAFQVPGNFDQPSHTIRRELAAEPPYAAATAGVVHPEAYDATTYLRALQELGAVDVDAWETTYLHVLHGPDPVFAWVSGTGARPTLQALDDGLRAAFEAEFKRRLRAAYPDQGHGVVLPFRRVFAVARTPGTGTIVSA